MMDCQKILVKNLENIFNMNLEQLEKLYKTLKQYNTKELNKIQGALSDFIAKNHSQGEKLTAICG